MPKNYQKAPRAIDKEMIKDLSTNALNAIERTAILRSSIAGKQWRGGNSGHKKRTSKNKAQTFKAKETRGKSRMKLRFSCSKTCNNSRSIQFRPRSKVGLITVEYIMSRNLSDWHFHWWTRISILGFVQEPWAQRINNPCAATTVTRQVSRR